MMASRPSKRNFVHPKWLTQSYQKQSWRQNHTTASGDRSTARSKESSFVGNSHIHKFEILITQVFRQYSKSDKTPPPPILDEISNLACKIIFTTPVREMEHVGRLCNSLKSYFLVMNHVKNDVAEGLFATFAKKLCERFTYMERLQDLLKDRKIPKETQEKWLQHQYEAYGRLLEETDGRSKLFLKELFNKVPLHVYKVVEALVNLPKEEFLVKYLNSLIKSLTVICSLSTANNKAALEHFQAIMTFAKKSNLDPETADLLEGHWMKFNRFSGRGWCSVQN